ncbi:MAG TPA: flagellar FliJ family protein [Terriglobales bacterium]|nr:flagellar FliJ family protein [Terriglobales bacterium]
MKRFAFPLEHVLNYKIHLQKNEKAILMDLQSRHQKLLAERDALTAKLSDCCREYAALCLKGAQVGEIVGYAVYLEELRRELEKLEEAVCKSQEAVDRQTGKVVAVNKEKRGLEILKDKQFGLYLAMARREDERSIEEYVATATPSAAWR